MVNAQMYVCQVVYCPKRKSGRFCIVELNPVFFIIKD